MRKEDTVRLDTHFLVRRIEILGFKQGWVADQVGVARKTVSRWVTGKVKRIGRDSADALAQLLGCSLDELLAADPVLASKAEQKRAATLIQQNDLLALLSPSDNWQLAESLIKASLQPDLPLADVGRLHNLLSIASWRQGRYEAGREHAHRALEIGERTGERSVSVGARYNFAVIESLCGDLAKALAIYEECLEQPEYFESKRDHAKVLSNVGDAYRSLLRFEESEATQRQAIALFEELGLDLNLAIAYVSLGVCLCEAGRFADAEAAFGQGQAHAKAAGYARGLDCAPIYLADARSLGGRTAEAREGLKEGLARLAGHGVYDLGCHASAARVFRRAGDLEAAQAQVDEGCRRAEPYPELCGMLLTEAARLALARGDATGEAALRARANDAFRLAGLEPRISDRPVKELGATTTTQG